MSDERVIRGVIYSSREFKYDKDQNCFSGWMQQTPGVLRELWGDDINCGFAIRSEKTGRVVCFELKDAAYAAGDHWRPTEYIFEAYNPECEPALEGMMARISNYLLQSN